MEIQNTMSMTTKSAQVSAFTIALITAITLLIRVYLAADQYGSAWSAISHLSQFFTILTNAIVMVLMFAIGLGIKPFRGLLEAVVVAIVGVGMVYHALLAHLWSPQGLAMLADQGVHTVVPAATFVWWLVFGNHSTVSWLDSLRGVVWPMIYVLYALTRAQFSGFYPYPFLNLPELGWLGIAVSIAIVSFAFLVIGLILVATARVRCRSKVVSAA